jgi:AraC family transcriptional regulator of adaptative response/methylated-DNA-[protein]-cysteine methyltransferase
MLQQSSGSPVPAREVLSGVDDYDHVRRAIEFLSERWESQPRLEVLSAHLGLSPAHTQRLFKRWCGLSPKEFVQAITIDRARDLLGSQASVLDASLEVGLSGGSRLHDLFVDHEAMTPGDFKKKGAGLDIVYGFHASLFGLALVMATDRGIAGLAFADGDGPDARRATLADMTRRWPAATFREDLQATHRHVERVFEPARWSAEKPVRLIMIGTDFEVRVWQALLRIPFGRSVSYAEIARQIGQPEAMRAVGSAIGRNPISFVVPCHRVRRSDGGLGGYHWGVTRKRAIIGWEKAQLLRQS